MDTVGAGDVFIGSMIAQLASSSLTETVDIERCLHNANSICGQKICQEGFGRIVAGVNS